MTTVIHNPDQHMAALRTIIAQGRKRIGLLIGAGAPAGMRDSAGNRPLIPAVVGLTSQVLSKLEPIYGNQIAALKAELTSHDIETILSRVRALSKVLGGSKVHDLDGSGYEEFGEAICNEIGRIVAVNLPEGVSAYSEIVNWITGTSRDFPVEIFTTNYDLLFEEAFERTAAPYYDGFTGGREPFFDPVSVASNDLPSRWTRLWKLHGSLGWKAGRSGEVVRTGHNSATHLVFPEYLKYDQTQKAPYAALLDRLRAFLLTPDTLLVSIGFSFQDSHISARISDSLAGNASASVFAFQFQKLENEVAACQLAKRLPNFSVYSPDMAKVNGARGPWVLPSELPTKDWGPIRATYWGKSDSASPAKFLLGDIEAFARFFAAARSNQAFGMTTTASAPTSSTAAS
ncbi:SIR2 family NAD-dependent protein deacylase [Bradyrhizobium sp. CCBAU 11357]|uniref:SIR2 family NAD-dependent protein deacylase n=1 Tax=Bradyrhizobium sp. CCBAU 11357 TaxID=1630808 RepID=UPI0023041ECB|nr:SIR2 family protein [Bradyrhizobium sp. CCBAU 11357]